MNKFLGVAAIIIAFAAIMAGGFVFAQKYLLVSDDKPVANIIVSDNAEDKDPKSDVSDKPDKDDSGKSAEIEPTPAIEPVDRPLVIFESSADLGVRLLLAADKADFEVGDVGYVVLTVAIPPDLKAETVIIKDDQGDAVITLSPESFAANRSSGQVSIDTSEPGVFSYKAEMGRYASGMLDVIVSPHVAIEDFDESVAVLQDLLGELEGKTGEERMAAAKAFLESDSRVATTYDENENFVRFATNSGISGFYDNAEFGDTLSLASGNASFATEDDTTGAFGLFETNSTTRDNDEIAYLDGGNAWTNNNVLVLRPAYDFISADVHMEIGKQLATALQGNLWDKNGEDVIYSIMAGELSNYGTVILNTHGGISSREDGSEMLELLVFASKDKANADSLLERLKNEGKLNSFYLGNKRLLSIGLKNDSFSILATSDYIMRSYQSLHFDNTVFYLGACDSYADKRFVQFLVNHGAKCVAGYASEVSIDTESQIFEEFFGKLIPANESGGLRGLPLAALEDEKIYDAECSLLAYANLDFTYGDYGDLAGAIKDKDTNEPYEGIAIEAWRFQNQEFIRIAETTSKSDGGFLFERLPWGVYDLRVSGEDIESADASYCLNTASANGGDILVSKKQLTASKFAEIVEYNGEIYSIFNSDVIKNLPSEMENSLKEYGISKGYATSFTIINDTIYYVSAQSSGEPRKGYIFKCNLDGSGRVLLANDASDSSRCVILNDVLYYDYYSGTVDRFREDISGIAKIDLRDSRRVTVVDGNYMLVDIVDNYLYFNDYYTASNRERFRSDLEGNIIETLGKANDRIHYVGSAANYMDYSFDNVGYFLNKGTLYRIDGQNPDEIASTITDAKGKSGNYKAILGDYLYYYVFEDKTLGGYLYNTSLYRQNMSGGPSEYMASWFIP
ncbi:MAG: DUF5050 domain-containing protein [Clostridiales bacterium]|nr:DUF5050 domain-containing protein [Clostridiales bacterium]